MAASSGILIAISILSLYAIINNIINFIQHRRLSVNKGVFMAVGILIAIALVQEFSLPTSEDS